MWARGLGIFSRSQQQELDIPMLSEVIVENDITQHPSILTELPVEMLVYIAKMLDCRSVANLARTSKQLNQLFEQLKEYQFICDLGQTYLSLKSQVEEVKPSLWLRISGNAYLGTTAVILSSFLGLVTGGFLAIATEKLILNLTDVNITTLVIFLLAIGILLSAMVMATFCVITVNECHDRSTQLFTDRKQVFEEISTRIVETNKLLQGDLPIRPSSAASLTL